MHIYHTNLISAIISDKQVEIEWGLWSKLIPSSDLGEGYVNAIADTDLRWP